MTSKPFWPNRASDFAAWRKAIVGLGTFYAVLFCLACTFNVIGAHYAEAQTQNVGHVPNFRLFGNVNGIATPVTSATTTPVVVETITNTTVNDPGELTSYNGTLTPEHLHITWSADVTKATAGGATCGLYLNGTLLPYSVRTFTPAAWPSRSTINGFYEAGCGSTGAGYTGTCSADPFNVFTPGQTQVVTLRCNSSDTNTLTVNQAQLYAEEVY